MKKNRFNYLSLIAALLLCCFMVPGVSAQQSCCDAAPVQVDTIAVASAAMSRSIKTVVVLPEQYFNTSGTRYPVMYLLHGAYGDYTNWPAKAPLDSLASLYGMIIVCPDGQDSWYFDSPVDPAFRFETFISSELVNYIDSHYRTIAHRSRRAITGLSMGGHGALWNAWRHPDVFGSCGSMSGGVDIVPFPGRWHIADRLGDYDTHKQVWEQHSVISLVPTLTPGQNIIIDDGLNDIFIKENNRLHEALLQRGIDHDYTVRPGSHSWDYWLNSLEYHVLFFSKAFARAQL